MGTRADFYVGRGEQAEWIGSTAWDGYPGGIVVTLKDREPLYKGSRDTISKCEPFPKGQHLFDASTPDEFRERVAQYFANRSDVTLPERGWPWPWEDSCTTDYAYALDEGKVWASCFGSNWFDPAIPEPDDEEREKQGKRAIFPNMKHRSNVRLDGGSGLIIMQGL